MSIGWVIRNLITIGAGTIACLLILAKDAKAYLVHEVRPGILEMRSLQDGSLVIQSVHVDKEKKWIYFSVKESKIINRNSTKYIRCFYAPYNLVNISRTNKLRFLRYKIGNRILNSRGKIPFARQRYFYPLVKFQTVS